MTNITIRYSGGGTNHNSESVYGYVYMSTLSSSYTYTYRGLGFFNVSILINEQIKYISNIER
jgi:hypothetical protein